MGELQVIDTHSVSPLLSVGGGMKLDRFILVFQLKNPIAHCEAEYKSKANDSNTLGMISILLTTIKDILPKAKVSNLTGKFSCITSRLHLRILE